MKYYIGIDNGVTGSVCVLDADGSCLEYWPTPVEKTLNYTKAKEYINRVRGDLLKIRLEPYAKDATVLIERPMVNPMRWKATVSAIRCDEATRIVLEMLDAKFIYVDSKEWQKPMLPKRTPVKNAPKDADAVTKRAIKAAKAVFKAETKRLSLIVGTQLFPMLSNQFKGDADAALIAEFARREKL